jgi:hypothetical protein
LFPQVIDEDNSRYRLKKKRNEWQLRIGPTLAILGVCSSCTKKIFALKDMNLIGGQTVCTNCLNEGMRNDQREDELEHKSDLERELERERKQRKELEDKLEDLEEDLKLLEESLELQISVNGTLIELERNRCICSIL